MNGSNKRKRLTADSSQLSGHEIFHSTAIEPSKRFAPEPHPNLDLDPVTIHPPSGYPNFSNVLQKHGFILGKPRNNLQIDQLSFRKSLADWLSSDGKGTQPGSESSKFIEAMKSYLSIRNNLIHSMTPTMQRDEVFQASLLHNLLALEDLQPAVFNVIFPVLVETAYIASVPADVELAITILNQIKWIPNLVDEGAFVSHIVEMVENANSMAQKEMLRFLPDVVPEKAHPQIGEMLRKLLDSGTTVVSSIMDCFSGLDIPECEWTKIRETALKQMFDAPLEDFPAYFGFLFRTENAANLNEIIREMREKLEITPMGNDDRNDAYMLDIADKIEFCCSINHTLVAVWIKLVKDDLSAGEEIKPLDLMMLLIFAEFFKSAIKPLKLVLSNHSLTIKLLDFMLQNNLPVLKKVFSTFLRICDEILRAKETKTKTHAVIEEILVKLFAAYGRTEAMEISSNLLNLLLTNVWCRDSALRVFTEASKQNPEKLLMFAPHLMSAVDSIMKFESHQIRQLMNVLAVLAHVQGSPESERFCTEFTILLRKQLTHTNVRTRCLGVLGALATVRELSLNTKQNGKPIIQLLDLAWTFVQKEEEPLCIFLDELCGLIPNLPSKFCRQFQTILLNKFQESWTRDHSAVNKSELTGAAGLVLVDYFDANKELDKDKLAIAFEDNHAGMSSRAVPSHLRAIQRLLDRTHKGDLSEIDAILGCPVLIPSIDLYYRGKTSLTFSQKHHAGLYLVLAINFFRESVSAFVEQTNSELRIKVWLRFSNIVVLQKILARQLNSFHSLPLAYATEKPIQQISSNQSDHVNKPKQGKKKPNSGKGTTEDVDSQATNQVDDVERVSFSDFEDSIQPKAITPYLRRFDSAVFNMLKYPFRVGDGVDFSPILLNISTSANESVKEVEHFTADTLILLLVEIRDQMNDSQISGFDILGLKSILKHFSRLTDSVAAAAQNKLEAKLETCLRLLFKNTSLYFECIAHKKDEDERSELFKKAISVLGERLKSKENDILSFSQALHKVNNHIVKYSTVVKDPSTALEHLHLLKCIHDLAGIDEELAKSIESSSELYLKTNWKLTSSQVETFLRVWLSKAANPVEVMRTVISSIFPNESSQEIPCNELFQSCSSANVHSWYAVLISFLAQHCSKHGRKIRVPEESYEFWSNMLNILKDLVTVRDSRKAILVPLLRHTRIFLEVFVASGIKLLPSLFNRNPDEAKTFTRILQVTTRRIQVICEHSKVEANVHLLKYVPLVKRALETLLFRVREVLTVEGAPNAFWMGSLKHRNLDGEVINSQMYEDVEVSDDDELSNADNEDAAAEDIIPESLNLFDDTDEESEVEVSEAEN